MSFGTFTLFNFLQQPVTGKTPAPNTYDPTPILQGAGRNGRVNDANWSFPYAGTLVPYEIVEGGGAVFQVRLLCDADVGNGGVGLRVGTCFSMLSGNVEGGIHTTSMASVLSGQFFPKQDESGFASVIFSGFVTGQPKDTSTYSVVMSGAVTGVSPDKNTFTLVMSGQITPCHPDSPIIQQIISGQVQNDNNHICPIKNTISGTFTPSFKDTTNLNYTILSFSTANNRIILETDMEDDCNLTYGITSYLSSRP